MLAKILAVIRYALTRKNVKWQELLPERFVPGALVANIPQAEEMRAITRELSSQLDQLASQFGLKK